MNPLSTNQTFFKQFTIAESEIEIDELTNLLIEHRMLINTSQMTLEVSGELSEDVLNLAKKTSKTIATYTGDSQNEIQIKGSLKRKREDDIANVEKKRRLEDTTDLQPKTTDNMKYSAIVNRINQIVEGILHGSILPRFKNGSLCQLRSVLHLVSHKKQELKELIELFKVKCALPQYNKKICETLMISPVVLSVQNWKDYWKKYDKFIDLIPVSYQDIKFLDSAVQMFDAFYLLPGGTDNLIKLIEQYQNCKNGSILDVIKISDALHHSPDGIDSLNKFIGQYQNSNILITLPELISRMTEVSELLPRLKMYYIEQWITYFNTYNKFIDLISENPQFIDSARKMFDVLYRSLNGVLLLDITIDNYVKYKQNYKGKLPLMAINEFLLKMTCVPEPLNKLQTFSTEGWIAYFSTYDKFIKFFSLSYKDKSSVDLASKMFDTVCNSPKDVQCLVDTMQAYKKYILENNQALTEGKDEKYKNSFTIPFVNKFLLKLAEVPELLQKLSVNKYSIEQWMDYFLFCDKYIKLIPGTHQEKFLELVRKMLDTLYNSPNHSLKSEMVSNFISIMSYYEDDKGGSLFSIPSAHEALVILSEVPDCLGKLRTYSKEHWIDYISNYYKFINLIPASEYEKFFDPLSKLFHSVCDSYGGITDLNKIIESITPDCELLLKMSKVPNFLQKLGKYSLEDWNYFFNLYDTFTQLFHTPLDEKLLSFVMELMHQTFELKISAKDFRLTNLNFDTLSVCDPIRDMRISNSPMGTFPQKLIEYINSSEKSKRLDVLKNVEKIFFLVKLDSNFSSLEMAALVYEIIQIKPDSLPEVIKRVNKRSMPHWIGFRIAMLQSCNKNTKVPFRF